MFGCVFSGRRLFVIGAYWRKSLPCRKLSYFHTVASVLASLLTLGILQYFVRILVVATWWQAILLSLQEVCTQLLSNEKPVFFLLPPWWDISLTEVTVKLWYASIQHPPQESIPYLAVTAFLQCNCFHHGEFGQDLPPCRGVFNQSIQGLQHTWKK